MNDKQHKDIFCDAIDRRLSGINEDPLLARRIMNGKKGRTTMKRKLKKVPVMAFTIIGCLLASVTVVAAADKLGIIHLFSDGNTTNTDIINGIQTPNEQNENGAVNTQSINIAGNRYEGENVCFTVNEALYDSIGETYALSWTIDNLNDREDLYIICKGISFGDEDAHQRTTSNTTDFILGSGTTECMALGELPENDSNECRMDFMVLRATAPFAVVTAESVGGDLTAASTQLRSEGYIPVDGMGIVCDIPITERGYAEDLLASGDFELVESFSLNFTLEQDKLDDTARVYSGPTEFVFDDYEIRIRKAVCTATAVYIDVEYITPEAPKDGGKGVGWLWDVQFDVPGVESFTGNAGGYIHDPVLLEDGRYMSLYEYEALQLYTQPDILRLTLVTYDENLNPVNVYSEDAIELKFE